MTRIPYRKLAPYLGAALIVAVALLCRWSLDSVLRNRQPFAPFLVAVLLTSRFCGFGPAVMSVFLSAGMSLYLFVPPRYTFWLHSGIELGSLCFFIFFGLLCAWIIRSEQAAKHRLELEVAERKRIDERLRLRESQLSGILDNTPAVIYLKDRDGRYLIANRSYENVVRYRTTELIGKTDRELFPEEIAAQFMTFDAEVWSSRCPVLCEEVAPHHDGLHTYRSIKFPVRDSTGAMVAMGGVSTDISDLKKARESLEDERELLRNLIAVQEKERQFLCHEFHDGLIQYAVAALMSLERLHDKPKVSDDSPLYAGIAANLRRGIEDGRRVIRGIRPAVLDDFGIEAAMEDLIGQFVDSGIMVTCKCDPAVGRLPDVLQTTFYRVVQEALNNSRKHSGTDVVRIEIKQADGTLHVDIQDFGCGFDFEARRKQGFGLLGMQERVRLLGGMCRIRSEPNVGTHVSVSLPMAEVPSASPVTLSN